MDLLPYLGQCKGGLRVFPVKKYKALCVCKNENLCEKKKENEEYARLGERLHALPFLPLASFLAVCQLLLVGWE